MGVHIWVVKMTFTKKRIFGTHLYTIHEDKEEIAGFVKEQNAKRIIDALNYFEGK